MAGRYTDFQVIGLTYGDVLQVGGEERWDKVFVPQAEGEVDARLAPKYTVPFTPCPPLIQSLATDLAYYKATFRTDGADKLKEYIDERFEGLLDGSLLLTSSGGAVIQFDLGTFHSHEGVATSFGVDAPENWAVNSLWPEGFPDGR